MPPPPGKILLIQLRRIGDTVLVTPALDALRAAWPGSRIHLLTESPASDLFEGDDRVDLVWLRPPRRDLPSLARELRREGFDLVVDFQSLPVTSLLARFTGAPTVGFRRRFRTYHRSVSLGDHRGTGYAADHKLDLLRVLDIDPASILPSLRIPVRPDRIWDELSNRPRVVLSPVSPWPHKRWDPDALARTVRLLHDATGAGFVVAGGPGEAAEVEAVAVRLGSIPHRTRVLSRLRELASLLAPAHLFLGNDNGPRHLAVALGLPTLGYFSEVNPVPWTPPGPRHPVLWELAPIGGDSVPSDRCILAPRPEAAAAAAARLLKAGLPPAAGAEGPHPTPEGTP